MLAIYLMQFQLVGQENHLVQSLASAKGKNRVEILLKLTDQYKVSKPDLAKEYALEANQLAKKLNLVREQIESYYDLGIIERDNRKYRRAVQNTEKGLLLANRIRSTRLRIEGNKILETIYRLNNRKSKAEDYAFVHQRIKDSLDQIAIQRKLDTLQEQYSEDQELLATTEKALETQKVYSRQKEEAINQLQETTSQLEYETIMLQIQAKDLERKNLLNELRLTQEKTRREKARSQRNLFMALSIVSILILIGLWLSYRLYRQRRLSKNEKERRLKLEQIDRLKDQFIANTSHELRTPLHGMIGLAESLRDGTAGEVNAEMVKNLNMIVHSGNRLSALINDLLDFSKLKSSQLDLDLKAIDLKVITDVVIQGIRPLAREKGLSIKNLISNNIAAVEADENRLQQILYNLLGNATKFTEKGDIRVQAEEVENEVRIKITDTGIGIPREKQKYIFNIFQQGDGSTEREHGGAGLGLTITKQLVELHGGRIEVISSPGRGSTFTFTLPKSDADKDVMISTPKYIEPELSKLMDLALIKESLSVDYTGGKKNGYDPVNVHILLVDDEPVNQQVLINHLKNERFEITSAMNGAEALASLDKLKFDLVLLDLMMPKMSGYEVCTRIREKYLPSELPIIMITAKNQVQDMVQGLRLGANDYLAKPFSKDEFLARVKTQINLHQISKATSKFVPYEFLKSIGREHITDVKLGDQIQKEVTVVFSDIRDYTTMSESMSPDENFKFVNAYVGRMGPIIRNHQGFVNQYLGDAIMSIFLDSPEDALKASIEMLKMTQLYNLERKNRGRNLLRIGIGMHTGQLIMGIIGDESRTDAATVADTVNTASRMEGLTKYYGVNLLLSEYSLIRLSGPENFNFRFLGRVQVKGKKDPVSLYECINGDTPEQMELKLESLSNFNQGVEHFFSQQFSEAEKIFSNILTYHEEDGPCKYFLEKTQKYLIKGVPDNWTGVEQMISK